MTGHVDCHVTARVGLVSETKLRRLMPPKRKTKPLSPDHAALAQAVEAVIAENEGMTQDTVAFDSGLTTKKISDLCRGQSNPTYLSLLKLCEGLHVRLGDLMVRADKMRDMQLG
jgi:DNA-binding phage protein